VDVLGGVTKAVAVAKQAAGIPADERVTVVELSRARTSPLALLGEGKPWIRMEGSLPRKCWRRAYSCHGRWKNENVLAEGSQKEVRGLATLGACTGEFLGHSLFGMGGTVRW